MAGAITLGDRMKMYEGLATSDRLMPRLPVCIRVDGRAFHSFCRNMEKPFDGKMRAAMWQTAIYLVEETNAVVAHTFSDEISLILFNEKPESELLFGGKTFKLVSSIASLATAGFNAFWTSETFAYWKGRLPTFDCRVWQVPTKDEAVNMLVWREQDSARNSIEACAQSMFSHKQLHKKCGGEMQDMMMEKGFNWNDVADYDKRGAYFRRVVEERELTDAERMKIPEKHRPPKDQKVMRALVDRIPLPRLTKIENRVEVIFEGAEPRLAPCDA